MPANGYESYERGFATRALFEAVFVPEGLKRYGGKIERWVSTGVGG